MNPMYSGHCTFQRPTNQNPRSQPNGLNLELTFADRKGGFPHSEIFGSKGARASPKLIAACHVLHRLSTPRHPSEALMRLIVLSKTHAWGQKCRRPGTKPTHSAHTCALSLPDYDVFTRIPLKQTISPPENPSLHNVIKLFPRTSRARPDTQSCENSGSPGGEGR